MSETSDIPAAWLMKKGSADDLRACAILADREGDTDTAERFRAGADAIDEARILGQSEGLEMAATYLEGTNSHLLVQAAGEIRELIKFSR